MLRFQASYFRLSPPIPSTSASSHWGADRGNCVRFVAPRCPDQGSASISLRIDAAWWRRRWGPVGGGASMRSGPERRGEERRRRNEEEGFLRASLLIPETIRHYNLLKQGFLEETKWHSSGQMHPHSVHQKGPNGNSSSIEYGFLRRFQSPTIFLKIACDGDLLLPIVVGEFAIERFLESLTNNKNEGCPSQHQFIKNLVGVLGHEVKMVQITKRVVNTYHASIILGKPAEMAHVNVDSRPSDAISVANTFKVPIYVSNDIVFKDAIKIVSGTWRKNGAKTVYDVLLDSAIEGHDFLSEELDFLRKMDTAINEERYRDAAIWRDKLTKLRMREQDS